MKISVHGVNISYSHMSLRTYTFIPFGTFMIFASAASRSVCCRARNGSSLVKDKKGRLALDFGGSPQDVLHKLDLGNR